MRKIHLLALPLLIVLTACYSVERTPVIRLSKDDIREVTERSAEDELMAPVSYENLQQWRRGKPFRPVLERASMLFPLSGEPLGFRTLYFEGVDSALLPDGHQRLTLLFRDSVGNRFDYEHQGENTRGLNSASVPMLVDMDVVNRADSLLRGRSLWPRNAVWLDPTALTPVKAQRFVEVNADSVVAGNEYFPCRLLFTDATGRRGCVLFDPSPSSSRSFSSQFFISNPRDRYRQITDERWAEVCAGRISAGMTKEEARLSLGAPRNVVTEPDYSKLIELWSYSDGVLLRFEDGILVSFRK